MTVSPSETVQSLWLDMEGWGHLRLFPQFWDSQPRRLGGSLLRSLLRRQTGQTGRTNVDSLGKEIVAGRGLQREADWYYDFFYPTACDSHLGAFENPTTPTQGQ